MFISGLLAGLMTMTANAADIQLDAAKLKEIKAATKALQRPIFQLKEGIDKETVYFLKIDAKSKRGVRPITAFVDKKTGAVYFGNGYDKEGKLMAFPKDEALIKKGITFSYGTGKKDLYIVTDPECPYCVKFEKLAHGKLDDYKVHVIFYPLTFHKKAPAMIEWIMQGKSDAEKKERFDKIVLEGSTEYKMLIKDDKKPFRYTAVTQVVINKAFGAIRELGTRGTPATYDEEFNLIPWTDFLKEKAEHNASKEIVSD